VDSIVPELPKFEFLRDRRFRVRTIKLRGQVSQGLMLPMLMLESPNRYAVGSDVTDVLGIKKYDPEGQKEAELLANQQKQEPPNRLVAFLLRYQLPVVSQVVQEALRAAGRIKKTDETRIQTLPVLFDMERKKGTRFSVTEKVDSQSATYFLRRIDRRKFEFGVCNRNLRLRRLDNNFYWTVCKQHDMEQVLQKLIGKHDYVVLQGEICGQGIQLNKYHITGYELFVFNLIFPDHQCTTAEIAAQVELLVLKTVPLVEEGKQLPETIAELVEYAKGQSVIRPEQKREGVVMRNAENNISFKVINPDFLLAAED